MATYKGNNFVLFCLSSFFLGLACTPPPPPFNGTAINFFFAASLMCIATEEGQGRQVTILLHADGTFIIKRFKQPGKSPFRTWYFAKRYPIFYPPGVREAEKKLNFS